MDIAKLFSDTIANAYVFHRDSQEAIILFLEKRFERKFGSHQSAILYNVETFSIEDSRTVSELANLQSEGQTFVAIVARSLTREAQHALLKTFEEPSPGVHFLLFVDNPALLLPTLLSRCISVQKNLGADGREIGGKNNPGNSGGKNKKSAQPDFLKISLAERFAYIEKIAKDLKKEDPIAFKDAATEIFDNVIERIGESFAGDRAGKTEKKINTPKVETLGRILELRKYLNDRGSSPKQLLETLAMQI